MTFLLNVAFFIYRCLIRPKSGDDPYDAARDTVLDGVHPGTVSIGLLGRVGADTDPGTERLISWYVYYYVTVSSPPLM